MTTPREDAIAALDWWANVTSRKHNPTVLRAACVDAPSGHWVDLASPETAEALAEHEPEVEGYCDSGDIRQACSCGWEAPYWDPRTQGLTGPTWVEHLLAAMRETGR